MLTYSMLLKRALRRAVMLLAAASVFACAFMCACSSSSELQSEDGIKVSVADSVFFTAENTAASVACGGSFSVTLNMRAGYIPVSCDYPDYSIADVGGGSYILTLENVTRPARVAVTSERSVTPQNSNEEKRCAIVYDFNDGSQRTQKEEYVLSYHIRPNTLGGNMIERSGYTLLGWNTEPDGSGEHIGAGSRVTVENGQTLTLYAEWVEQLPEEDFLCRILPDGTVALSGYRGSGDMQMFAVPSEMAGRTVTEIASSFTTNIPCGTITSRALVLPATLKAVKGSAFVNSQFSEIYFFDSLEEVSSEAFSQNISVYHVNANTPPRLQGDNYNARFADNLDLIISAGTGKKLIFFSGCSLAYGLVSPVVAGQFDDYTVVNAGLNGEFNALFQLECMLPYISEGDVLVHAPEQMNPYQFLASMKLDGRVFAMVEGNYDLLAAADFSYTDGVFEAWTMYCNLRSGQEDGSYADYTDMFNNYGDYSPERPYDEGTESSRDVAFSQGWGFDMALLTEDNIAALAEIYGRFEEKGAKVYFSWAPMNEQSDGNEDIYAAAEQFQTRLGELFRPYGYELISEVTDYIYRGRYFYDTDYHLNDLGAVLRTEQLIKDLRRAGVK